MGCKLTVRTSNIKKIPTHNLLSNIFCKIGIDAFVGCENVLEKIDGVTYLDTFALNFDSKYTNVVIREGTKTLANGIFNNCNALTSVSLPKSLKTIGDNAFVGAKMTSITIPEKVSYIGKNAFKSCSNLTDVVFSNTNGWTYANEYTISPYEISNRDLGSSTKAATYLKSSYCDYFWERK